MPSNAIFVFAAMVARMYPMVKLLNKILLVELWLNLILKLKEA